jgi:hypothetical protein
VCRSGLRQPPLMEVALIWRFGCRVPFVIERGVWEIDAHFGITGKHVLQLVAANDLGNALVRTTEKSRNRIASDPRESCRLVTLS